MAVVMFGSSRATLFLLYLSTAACFFTLETLSNADLRFHDQTHVFRTFWEEAKELPAAEQVRQFKDKIYPTLPSFYQARFKRLAKLKMDPDQVIFTQLNQFPHWEKRFFSESVTLKQHLTESFLKLKSLFRDFYPQIDVHFIHSLHEMDGGTRRFDGRLHLIFGMETIAEFHPRERSPAPFLQHELFHVYHDSFLDRWEGLYSPLWAEGLAVYISALLNPSAPLSDLYLDEPRNLIPQCERVWNRLIEDILLRMDLNDDESYAHYFLGESKHGWIPKRAGYYLGYRVAQKVAESGLSLPQMVRLKGDSLRAVITRALWKLKNPLIR